MRNKTLLTSKREIMFFSFLGISLLIFFVISFIFGRQVRREDISVPAHVVEETSPFDGIKLTAKAAYVYDARTGKTLFGKNENEKLSLASLTKVMTAIVALDIATPDTTVVVSPTALLADGDSGLFAGERWNLKKLLDFSLTSSSNDGMTAVALALGALGSSTATDDAVRADFIRQMNTKATSLGLTNTVYYNETGLDESVRQGGAYGSARDMAMLFNYGLKNRPDLFQDTRLPEVKISSFDMTHTAHNTDSIVSNIPGIKASKTGFTDIAGGNLVIAFDPEIGHPIIISVLGSTQAARFTDVEKLVKASLEAISREHAGSTPAAVE